MAGASTQTTTAALAPRAGNEDAMMVGRRPSDTTARNAAASRLRERRVPPDPARLLGLVRLGGLALGRRRHHGPER